MARARSITRRTRAGSDGARAGSTATADGGPDGDVSLSYVLTIQPTCDKEHPNVISFQPSFGDGSVERWPKLGESGPGGTSTRVPKHDEKSIKWRSLSADVIARELGLWNEDNAKFWILSDLPTGYILVDHVASSKEGSPNSSPRTDRFIFGHEGRKLRSALGLGRHISWLLLGALGPCPCDCNTKVSQITLGIPPIPGPPEPEGAGDEPIPRSSTKRKATSPLDDSNSVTAKTKSRSREQAVPKRPSLPPSSSSSSKIPPPAAWSKPSTVTRRPQFDRASNSSSSAVPRASSSSSSELPPPPRKKRASAAATKHEFDVLQPLEEDTTAIGAEGEVEREQYDPVAGWISQPRVGDLVWHAVPPSLELWGQKKIDYWPAIVTDSSFVEKELSSFKVLSLELLTLGEVVEDVELPSVLPWLAYEPLKLEEFNIGGAGPKMKARDNQIEWDELSQKRTREELFDEGREAIGQTFVLAWRTGQWISSIQLRSPPEIEKGPHLFSLSGVVGGKRKLHHLTLSTPTTRYLSHSWIAYGPEVLHLGDYVRLLPSPDLPTSVLPKRSAATPSSLPTCLILQIHKFIRGGVGSPLTVRGKLMEMDEGYEGETERDDEDDEDEVEDEARPPAFPAHGFRCLAETIDLLLDTSIAGRYYPLLTPEDETELELVVNGRNAIKAVRKELKDGKVGGLELRKLQLAGVELFDVPVISTFVGVEKDDPSGRLSMASTAALAEMKDWCHSRRPPQK